MPSYIQSAVIVLVGIKVRVYALVWVSEHEYVCDVTSFSIRHSI